MYPFEVKYILFTHLPYREKDKQAWDLLESRAKPLSKCLNSSSGMLVVFLDTGWLSLLNTIGRDFDPVKMTKEFGIIKKTGKRVATLKKNKRGLKDRLRLVTAETLYPILNNLRGSKPGLEATRLKNFLVGNDPGVRYDTTKVAEAIIRVRHLGSGIPVLRIDWDALLNKDTLKLLDKVTRKITKYCDKLAADHRIHSYIISGLYTQPIKNNYKKWDINDFNTAFATRMFPALVPTEDAIKKLNKLTRTVRVNKKSETQDGAITSKVLKCYQKYLFDNQTMIKYYGLNGSPNAEAGLRRLGSNPCQSVVSGAGLVISEGAILDLPPFSNFQQNVMWIDDYLKYELHRALDHFSKVKTIIPGYKKKLEPCRHPKSKVYKDRILGGQGNLRPYVLGSYIPTLFWGILVDAWIRGEPPLLVKQSPFVAALANSLKRGIFDESERRQLKEDLDKITIKRINKVIKLWSALKDGENWSFAALWVGGNKSNIERVMEGLTPPKEADNWLGWGLLENPRKKIQDLAELREPNRKIVVQLIDDMCTYIDWTLEWPKFIQSVRAVKTGSLELDVSYVPPK